MRITSREAVERAAFLVSVVVLACLYGFLARGAGWFPGPQLTLAYHQAQRLMSEPDFLSERIYDRSGTRSLEPGAVAPGLTLISSHWPESDWKAGLRLVDREGRVLHRWDVDPGEIFAESENRRPEWSGVGDRSIHGAHLFPDGGLLLNIDYVGTVRMDACGRVEWRLPAGGHHSIEPAGDGTFWIPGSRRYSRPRSPSHPDGYTGLEGKRYQDLLLRVSGEGEVLEEIFVLDLLYANGLQRHIVQSGQVDATDVAHLNDIEPLPAELAREYPGFEPGDLLLSLRNLHLVLVVDPETLEVRWHASHPFVEQHDPNFLGDGWIGVLDNNRDGTERGDMLGGTRIVAVRPGMDSVRVLFPTARSDPLYTPYLGKWQRLENGNFLITDGRNGRVVEVGAGGPTVWEWVGPPYEGSRIAEVGEGTRLDLSAADVATWPCAAGERGEREEVGK